MNKFTKFILAFAFGFLVLVTAQSTSAQLNVLQTTGCSGLGVTSICNARCDNTPAPSFTETRAFYLDGGFIGGFSEWDDHLGYS